MEPPTGFLWILTASAHIDGVVRRSFLVLATGEHADDRETDRLHAERRRPVVRENGETDVPIAVHVRMHGNVVADEDHFGGSERVLLAEAELQTEVLAVVQRRRRSVHFH